MAYFCYLIETNHDCLISTFGDLLDEAGFNVLRQFSNQAQVFAESVPNESNPTSKVKILISWSNKSLGQCSLEVRSDEPHLKNHTSCEQVAKYLHSIIPSKKSLIH